MNDAEVKYGTTEKELLAIVYSVTKCRTYFIVTAFEIITDHKALSFLDSTRYHSARLIRWCMILQQYSFVVRYCTGRDNLVVDFFSRNPSKRFEDETLTSLTVAPILSCIPPPDERSENPSIISKLAQDLARLPAPLKYDLLAIRRLQLEEPNISKIREQVKVGKQIDTYCLHNDVLFRLYPSTNRWLLVRPKALQLRVLEHFHGRLEHPGVSKTIEYLREYFYWDHMSKGVKVFVKMCNLYQRSKSLTYSMQGSYQLVAAKSPGELVTVDFYGALPRAQDNYQYIFVMLDAFFKHERLYPLRNATTHSVLAKVQREYIPELSRPKAIVADNGSQFTSRRWRDALAELRIKPRFCSIRHPQSNPTDRIMKELGRFFRVFCAEAHNTWAKYVLRIERLLNITTHPSTGFTPFELHFGKRPQDELD